MKVFQRFNIRARPSVCWWLCRSTNGIIVIENYNPDLTEKKSFDTPMIDQVVAQVVLLYCYEQTQNLIEFTTLKTEFESKLSYVDSRSIDKLLNLM